MTDHTATPLSDSRGLGKVAVTFFEQLARNLEELQGAHTLALVKSALDMLITVIRYFTSKVSCVWLTAQKDAPPP